ncbi:MAG TPA: FlgD immunoglobulin-like domain containing protein, partial [candidate division Zixibacteria bacterium]
PAGDADYYWTSVASSSDGVKLIATAFNDYIYTSTDTGATWTEHQAGGSIQCWYCSASSSDGNKLIAGVYSNRLYTSTNSGVTWTETQPAGDVDRFWRCTASSADGDKLIAGVYLGRLYTSTDAGITWTERQPLGNGNAGRWSVASSADGTRLVAGLFHSRLYTSTDTGETWTEQQPAGDEWRDWACAVGSSDGTRLIVGSYDGVYDINDGRLYTGVLQAFFTISGYVRTSDSTGIDSVVMSGLPGNPQTDTNGYYIAEVDSGWSGVVKPTKFGYTFDPESTSYSSVTDNQETDYVGTYLTHTISGYVRNTDSIGMEGVVLSGLPGDPTTDTGGYYSATIPYGWSGRVTPTDTCVFDPEYRDYDSVTSDQTYQSYVEDCFSQGVDDDEEKLVPKEYELSQNHPNPFNPETEIVFGLPKAGFVTLKIYNILGQEVTTLFNKNLSAGRYRIIWNGTDKAGRAVSSGVYFYRMQAGDFVQTKRMLLLK